MWLKKHSLPLLTFTVATGIVGVWTMASLDTGKLHGMEAVAIANGQAGTALQSSFDGSVPFRKFAIAATASLRHSVFGEGFQGVLAGSDGWLFSAEEFEEDLGYLDGGFDELVAAVHDTLATRGIGLVVVVVPSKTRILESRLGRIRIPETVGGRYQALLEILNGLSVPKVDLVSVFAAYQGDEELYLRTDSHWSQAGAKQAAESTALVVRSIVSDLPTATVSTTTTGQTMREGDLMSYLPARGTSLRPIPPPESMPTLETVVDSGAGLFDTPSIPVAIVGTSYSAEPAFHFEGFLKQALSADVINLALEGKGPFKPMDEALQGTILEDTGVRVVVWEIPERYVPSRSLR